MSRIIRNEDLINIETLDEVVARHVFYSEFKFLKQKIKLAESKLKDINYILLSVVIILLVMVGTLIVDSFHFNSATYKEYSQKTEAIEMIQKTNEATLKQLQNWTEQNNQNQAVIIEFQKQIKQLIEKK